LLENEAQATMQQFHKGDCGKHLYWKTTTNKILRAGLYWPSLFADVYKKVASCREFQMFEGRKKLLLLPLKPIEVDSPFHQWGLNFIGEIHPTFFGQYKWILTKINYFTKWIKEVLTRQAMNTIIIQFLEGNTLSCFGCPQNIITDNATAFRSKNMIELCHRYNIILGHSTTYYP